MNRKTDHIAKVTPLDSSGELSHKIIVVCNFFQCFSFTIEAPRPLLNHGFCFRFSQIVMLENSLLFLNIDYILANIGLSIKGGFDICRREKGLEMPNSPRNTENNFSFPFSYSSNPYFDIILAKVG